MVAETTSTNTDLLAAAQRGAPDRSVLMAGFQTAGRGRLDRTWQAPPDTNLLVSLLFRSVPEAPSSLTRRVGVAVVDAVASLTGESASLKWPNDVLLGDRKLAGILAQRGADGVVVGLGLNVGWAPEGAARLGDDVSPAEVLVGILEAYDTIGDDLEDRYRSVLSTLGRQVRVELPDGEIVGTAIDVAPSGHLVVIDTCAITHRISVGDIVHLRT